MKKSIIIFSATLTTLSLMAFGFINWNDSVIDEVETSGSMIIAMDKPAIQYYNYQVYPDFFYEVDSRFATIITKEKLHRAKSIIDIAPEESTKGIESFQNVKIGIFSGDNEKFEMGDGNVLNAAQLNLLHSTDYSTNFYIDAVSSRKNPETGKIEKDNFVYYMTVVPEKEAEYKYGHVALMNYLKENSKTEIAKVRADELKPGQAYFTVTKNGEIANIKLESSSGYTSVDNTMIELLKTLPGKWNPATNSKGEKVDQKLVFSFGTMGC